MFRKGVLPLFILCMLAVGNTAEAYHTGDDDVSFQSLSEQLIEAVEKRNFQEAREVVDKMLPLMKKDLKESKKMISKLQKEAQIDKSVENIQEGLKRKMELFDSIQGVVSASPAALRGKAKLILAEVEEFVSLTAERS